MVERKIIFKAPTGSSLYGLRKLGEKEQHIAVFLPSSSDLLSLFEATQEQFGSNCHYISLHKFFHLLLTGHLNQLEMLHLPENMLEVITPEWERILNHKDYFLTYTTLQPTLNFASAQLKEISSTNIIDARKLIQKINSLPADKQNLAFGDHCLRNTKGLFFDGILIEHYVNEMKEIIIKLCGREFNANIRTKTLKDKLRSVEVHSQTRPAIDEKYDYSFDKLAAAFRQVDEIHELITTKTITFPRDNTQFLKTVAEGTVIDLQWPEALQQKIATTDQIAQKEIGYEVNRKVIDDLYIDLISNHFKG